MTDTVREIDALIDSQTRQGKWVEQRMGIPPDENAFLRTAAALEAAKGLYEALGYYDSANYIDGPHWNRQRVPDGERAHEARAAFEAVFRKGAGG